MSIFKVIEPIRISREGKTIWILPNDELFYLEDRKRTNSCGNSWNEKVYCWILDRTEISLTENDSKKLKSLDL